MNFIKKNVWLVLIVILAAILRLINIDKPEGLWYDEMTIYTIAVKSFPQGMMQADAHRFLLFPLYYLIYHIWLVLFGNSDLIIRLMSVTFDVMSVIAAYYAGKEFSAFLGKSNCGRKTGFLYALLYAVNSSFIYYAQEAKFYSLTFLLVNILIIFWLKFLKESKYFLLFYISMFLLIYTYTSQVLLAGIIYILTLLFFACEHKFKQNLVKMLLLLTVFIPFAAVMFCMKDYFSGNFSAIVYDNSFILLALQNYFTPFLAGLQNNILHFETIWLRNILNLKFWIFVVLPVCTALFCMAKSVKNFKNARIIFLVPVIFLLTHILLSNFTYYKVLVRYTLMILPFLLLLFASGLCTLNGKFLKISIVSFFVVSNLVGGGGGAKRCCAY